MIEINIRDKEEGSELVRLEIKGAGEEYDPRVPALLGQAMVDYLCRAAGLDKVNAVANLITSSVSYLKLLGVSNEEIHRLADVDLNKGPNPPMRH